MYSKLFSVFWNTLDLLIYEISMNIYSIYICIVTCISISIFMYIIRYVYLCICVYSISLTNVYLTFPLLFTEATRWADHAAHRGAVALAQSPVPDRAAVRQVRWVVVRAARVRMDATRTVQCHVTVTRISAMAADWSTHHRRQLSGDMMMRTMTEIGAHDRHLPRPDAVRHRWGVAVIPRYLVPCPGTSDARMSHSRLLILAISHRAQSLLTSFIPQIEKQTHPQFVHPMSGSIYSFSYHLPTHILSLEYNL